MQVIAVLVFLAISSSSLQAAVPNFVEPTVRSATSSQPSISVDSLGVEMPEAVRIDADADGRPDRMGQTVRVGGRVGAATGVVANNATVIQADGHGITLVTPGGPAAARGDSVVATGVVEQEYGRTQVRVSSYSVLPVPPRVPTPVKLEVGQAVGERYESVVATISGRVKRKDRNDGGHYLMLESAEGSDVLAVFVSMNRVNRVPLSEITEGDEVTVSGVLQQHDYTSPYTSYYEIIPRSSADIVRTAIPRRYYRNALLIGGLLIVLSVGAVVLLRVQVRRRTNELGESRARFQRLAEATFEGIVIHAEGTIIDVNQAISQMTGYQRDEILGRNVIEFVSESTRPIAVSQVARDGEDPYECVLVRKDGSTFPADIQAKTVKEGDRKLRIVAVRDATERKQHETELLLAKQEAEQVARLKSSLLNNMSHELRTPITSIIGYAELIMDEPAEMHNLFARRIRESGRRLSETLRSVLDMAQIEAGTVDLHVAEVDMGRVASEVVAAHEPMASSEGVALYLNIDDAPTVSTDRVLCYRILTNLVHNALKFTNEGHVRITVEESEPGVRFIVEDTGIGIDSTFIPHLFEPFKQESDGRTRTHEGTGLGLAITKRMVDLLGGHINVESDGERGTCFTVDLPPSLVYNNGHSSVLRDRLEDDSAENVVPDGESVLSMSKKRAGFGEEGTGFRE